MRSSWLYFAMRVGTGQRAGLDLQRIGRNCQIGDGGVFRLTGAVRNHSGVAGALGHLDGSKRLGQGAGSGSP